VYQDRVQLIGYLGKNREAETAKQSQRKYTVFSLASKPAWRGADEEWHSKTEWHKQRCYAFKNSLDIINNSLVICCADFDERFE